MNKENDNKGILESLEILKRTINEIPEFEFFGSELLKKKCDPLERNEFGQPETERLAKKMIDVLKRYRERNKIGRGLAANQIGISKRMIVVYLEKEKPEVMINPEVLELTEEKDSYWECCMSSGAMLIGEVIRSRQGKFKYRDIDGGKHLLEADSMQTRLMLHEIDHLDGITCLDRYEPGTTRITRGVEDIKSGGRLEKTK